MKTPAAVLLACLALAATLAPAAAGAAPTHERITIDTWAKGLFGYVETAKPNACAAQRAVVVYKQLDEQRDPASDRRLGASKAKRTAGGYQWSLRGTGQGDFYARAEAKPGCAALKSRGFARAPKAENDSLCSPWSGPGWCRIASTRLHYWSERCTNFVKGSGDCNTGGNEGDGAWPFSKRHRNDDLHGELQWHTEGGLRHILYYTHTGSDYVGISHIAGTLPNAGSDQLTVTDAYAQRSNQYGDGPHFSTPIVAGAGVGQQGGPLGFNFDASTKIFFGQEDIYMWGWLYRK